MRPKALRPGARIGIAAPASPFDKKAFDAGVNVLSDMGFTPVYFGSLFAADRYLAGPDAHRLQTIQDLFADSTIDAVWCARGGYGSLRLLAGIDYEKMAAFPKLFLGCSDISALVNTLYSRCGWTTLHAPMVTGLGNADAETRASVQAALTGKKPPVLIASETGIIAGGKAQGPVVGGNLSTLSHMLATPYAPDFTDCIVFFEDIGEKPYRIDRMLTQMRLAGCFDRVAGICFGSFTDCGKASDIRRIFEDCFSNAAFPVLSGFSVGHDLPNLTLPIGLSATVDTQTASLTYAQAPAI
ncbi:MAG: S66 peptidase family protein [Thermodesulfobacteriota bacterium]